MKKSRKRLMILFVIALVVLSYTGTALASGETIYHTGTSSYSYDSIQSVPQKSDNHLYCDSASKSHYYVKSMAMAGGDVVSTNEEIFETGNNLYIPDTSRLRLVAIRIQNYGLGWGVSIDTEGWWTLHV